MLTTRLDRPGLVGLPREEGPARYLFFTNECVGLGHLRRCLTLAEQVRRVDPDCSVLIVTGSQVVPHALPTGIDIVKLPAIGRTTDGVLSSGSLGLPRGSVSQVRARTAAAVAAAFAPDVVVVDKLPLGVDAELESTLRALRPGHARVVLGLRDVEDDPEVVRRRWDAARHGEVLRDLYDQVLVYGPPSSPDLLTCVGWSGPLPPVEHVGFVGAEPEGERPEDLPEQYLLVTVGGGVDGHPVAAAVVEAVRVRRTPVPVVVVTGPLMPPADVDDLVRRAEGLPVTVHTRRDDLGAMAKHARAAVAMAGYNTVSELLRAGTPALLVPRVRPSSEQLIRATHLAEAGLATMAHPDRLDPVGLRAALDELLARPRRPVRLEGADGAERAAVVLREQALLAVGA